MAGGKRRSWRGLNGPAVDRWAEGLRNLTLLMNTLMGGMPAQSTFEVFSVFISVFAGCMRGNRWARETVGQQHYKRLRACIANSTKQENKGTLDVSTAMGRYADLLTRILARALVSPHACLRGTASLVMGDLSSVGGMPHDALAYALLDVDPFNLSQCATLLEYAEFMDAGGVPAGEESTMRAMNEAFRVTLTKFGHTLRAMIDAANADGTTFYNGERLQANMHMMAAFLGDGTAVYWPAIRARALHLLGVLETDPPTLAGVAAWWRQNDMPAHPSYDMAVAFLESMDVRRPEHLASVGALAARRNAHVYHVAPEPGDAWRMRAAAWTERFRATRDNRAVFVSALGMGTRGKARAKDKHAPVPAAAATDDDEDGPRARVAPVASAAAASGPARESRGKRKRAAASGDGDGASASAGAKRASKRQRKSPSPALTSSSDSSSGSSARDGRGGASGVLREMTPGFMDLLLGGWVPGQIIELQHIAGLDVSADAAMDPGAGAGAAAAAAAAAAAGPRTEQRGTSPAEAEAAAALYSLSGTPPPPVDWSGFEREPSVPW